MFKAAKNTQLCRRYLIKTGLTQFQRVTLQIWRSAQLNDIVTIFLVNDVLTVVNYSLEKFSEYFQYVRTDWIRTRFRMTEYTKSGVVCQVKKAIEDQQLKSSIS